jgi:hypothetical protein
MPSSTVSAIAGHRSASYPQLCPPTLAPRECPIRVIRDVPLTTDAAPQRLAPRATVKGNRSVRRGRVIHARGVRTG